MDHRHHGTRVRVAAHGYAPRALIALLVAGCAADGPHTSAASSPDAQAPSDGGGAVLEAGRGGPELPWPMQRMPEMPTPADNPTTDEKVALGRLLFYDPIFSSDREVACATCHSEAWGMGDALDRSVGVGAGSLAGPGRSGPNVTRRNAQTMWNVGYRETLFWDGRSSSLEEQVRFPFDTEIELGRPAAEVTAEIAAIPEYARRFELAFPGEPAPVTFDNLARAISAFERSLVSDNSLYDAYLDGDEGALTDETRWGMELFAEEGCAGCHIPPLFASERYENRGVPPAAAVEDTGRFEVTGSDADRDRFKVPTLRNARETEPFFHTGSAPTLADAVLHEVTFSVDNEGARPLDEDELDALTAFILKALHDPTRNPIRPREVPSGLPVPIDGFNIRR